MQLAKVTIKGQIVIPVALRKKTGIKPGTQVFLEEKRGEIILHPATPEFYERHFGLLKGHGLTQSLKKMRDEEKTHEAIKTKSAR